MTSFDDEENEHLPTATIQRGEAICRARLPRALAIMLDPRVSEDYLTIWTSSLRDTLNIGANASIDAFAMLAATSGTPGTRVRLWMQCGIFKAMLGVSQLRTEAARYARVYALQIIADLIINSKVEDMEMITKQLIELDAVRVLRESFNSNLYTQRAKTTDALRAIFNFTLVAERMKAQEIADLFVDCAQYILRGSKEIVDEILDDEDENGYQVDIMRPMISPEEAEVHAPYYYAQSQDYAIWCCNSVLARLNRPTRQQCLEVLQCKPEIVDMLLEVAQLPRTEAFPEWSVDSMALETLYQLVMLPYEYVPGLDSHLNQPLDGSHKAELDAAIKCIEIMVTRPRWLEMLTAIRAKIMGEDTEEMFRMIYRGCRDRNPNATQQDTERTMMEVAYNRGHVRIVISRILINTTFISLSSTFTPLTLLAYLPLAYQACRKFKTPPKELIDGESAEEGFKAMRNAMEYTERQLVEVDREPFAPVDVMQTPGGFKKKERAIECAVTVPSEVMLGPTLLFRTLFRLSEAGWTPSVLNLWTEIPSSPSSDNPFTSAKPHILHIKQISNKAILEKVIRASCKTMVDRRKEVNEMLKEGHTERARARFIHITELALALLRFATYEPPRSDSTNLPVQPQFMESIDTARKEVVLCLGNAAEASLRQKSWALAEVYAKGAVDAAEVVEAPTGDAGPSAVWDKAASKAKNGRRLANAKREA